jgi:hypothetical protein
MKQKKRYINIISKTKGTPETELFYLIKDYYYIYVEYCILRKEGGDLWRIILKT